MRFSEVIKFQLLNPGMNKKRLPVQADRGIRNGHRAQKRQADAGKYTALRPSDLPVDPFLYSAGTLYSGKDKTRRSHDACPGKETCYRSGDLGCFCHRDDPALFPFSPLESREPETVCEKLYQVRQYRYTDSR